MATTISSDYPQSITETIVAQVKVPGITVQVEDSWLNGSGNCDIYQMCRDYHAFSLLQSTSKDGMSWYRLSNKDKFVPERRFSFLPAGLLRHAHTSNPRGSGRTLTCYFDPAAFDVCSGLDSDFIRTELSACHSVDGPFLSEAMTRLFNELSSPGFASDVCVDSLGRLIMVEIGRHFRAYKNESATVRGGLTQQYLDRIRAYVENTDQRVITVLDLAQLCNMNPDYLRRAFKKNTGKTLATYVEEVRVSKAKALLGLSSMTLKQVAHLLGFATPSAFSHAFRRCTGETPKTYRRKMTVTVMD